jgi:acetyl-CoA carboxylase beta subunit
MKGGRVAVGRVPTQLTNFGNLPKINKIDKSNCSKCGYIHENLTLDVRKWICPECDTHHDRDINASTNILIFSDPQIRQELPKSTPKEPVERQGYQGGYSLGLGSP